MTWCKRYAIISHKGGFIAAVKRIHGWVGLGEDGFEWPKEYWVRYCLLDTEAEATKRLLKYSGPYTIVKSWSRFEDITEDGI